MHPGVLVASVLAGLFGVAIVAVLVSQRAQTSNVIGQTGTALSSVISAAVSPVTGTSSAQGTFVGNSTGNATGLPTYQGPTFGGFG